MKKPSFFTRTIRSQQQISMRAFAMFAAVVLSSFVANALPTTPKTDDLLKQLLQRKLDDELKNHAFDTFKRLVANHELTAKANSALDWVNRSGRVEFLHKQDLTREQFRALSRDDQRKRMVDFLQKREEVKPEVKAWLQLTLGLGSARDETLSAYALLKKSRPTDLVPRMFLLANVGHLGADPAHTKHWEVWLEAAEEGLPLAKTMDEKETCVLFATFGILKLDETEKGAESSRRLWKAVRNVEPDSRASADMQQLFRFNTVKAVGAMTEKDFISAADYSRQSLIRTFGPLFLAFAEKPDEAIQSLQNLHDDASLSTPERAGLRELEPLILIRTYKFKEARESLRELRANPLVTTEKLQYFDLLEKIISDFEGARKSPSLE